MAESIHSLMVKHRSTSAEFEPIPPPKLNHRSTSSETTPIGPFRAKHRSVSEDVTPKIPSPLKQTIRPSSSSDSSEEPDHGNDTGTGTISDVAPQIPPLTRVSEIDHPAFDANLDGVREQEPERPSQRRGVLSSDGEDVEDIDKLIAELEAADGEETPAEEKKEDGKEKPIPDHWLRTDTDLGLTTTQVLVRRKTCGFNEMRTEKENKILKFLGYFVGPIQFVMEVSYIYSSRKKHNPQAHREHCCIPELIQ